MSEPNDTHTTAWRFVRRRQARGSPPRRRATARYRRECKPPEPCVFSKNLPGFQKLFKSLLCQNSQISLNLRSARVRFTHGPGRSLREKRSSVIYAVIYA